MLPLQNAMAAVREGGGSVLHINPHLLWAPRDTPFQSHDGSAMNFYETHIEVRGPHAPARPFAFRASSWFRYRDLPWPQHSTSCVQSFAEKALSRSMDRSSTSSDPI